MHKNRQWIYMTGIFLLLLFAACAPKAGMLQTEGKSLQEEDAEDKDVMSSAALTQAPELEENSNNEKLVPQITPQPPTPAEAPSLSLVMVGDVLLHTRILEGAQLEDGTYSFASLFENITEEIQAADLAIVNQEVILGGSELGVSGYPAFNAPYEAGDALVAAGFDLICHATNHALDKGKKGLLNCIGFWKEQYPDIGVIGIYNSAEGRDSIYLYEANGITVAVLNYTYGTNGIALPKDMPYAVSLLDRDRVIADLKKADELADFVIVCPHWGTEYVSEPTKEQKKWAKLFEENGADLVLGTHPHVIEPIEWQGNMLVYYSIGNFANWTSGTKAGTADRMVGGMAEIILERAEDGTVYVAEYGVTPLICHVEEGKQKVTVYTIYDYTKELGEQNAIRNQDAAFSYEYCAELCERIWGELWR